MKSLEERHSDAFHRWLLPRVEAVRAFFDGQLDVTLTTAPGPRFGVDGLVTVSLSLPYPMRVLQAVAQIRIVLGAYSDPAMFGYHDIVVDGVRCDSPRALEESLKKALVVAEAGLRLGAGM